MKLPPPPPPAARWRTVPETSENVVSPPHAAAVVELRDRLTQRAVDQATKQAIEEIDAGAKKPKARRKKKADA